MNNKIKLYFGLSYSFALLAFLLHPFSTGYYHVAKQVDISFLSMTIPKVYPGGAGIALFIFAILFNISSFSLAILLTLELKKIDSIKIRNKYILSKIFVFITVFLSIWLAIIIFAFIAFVIFLLSKNHTKLAKENLKPLMEKIRSVKNESLRKKLEKDATKSYGSNIFNKTKMKQELKVIEKKVDEELRRQSNNVW
ncbi:hypothetical protein AB5V95_00755 [Metamycoplasma spumans]|uniref:hypothetical protein n=1 Tax=Metamycoplasma spumans TaxID=92406 RepID=UPI0034DD02CD